MLPSPAKLAEVVSTYEPAPGLGDGVLAKTSRSVYRYHQVFAGPGRTFTRKSLYCAVQLTPYAEGMIRPHEHASLRGREEALAKIRRLRGHIEPVVMGYRDPATEVERLCRKGESFVPDLEVKTADGVVHKLWRIQDAETIGGLRRYFAPRKLHLLEGHDRYEAMLAYHAEITAPAQPPPYSSANFGLACLTSLDDAALATAPRHRILRGASTHRDAVVEALGNRFIVEKIEGAARDIAKQLGALAETVAHQPAVVAAFAGEPDAWKLTLSPDASPVADGVQIHRALQRLEPIAVQLIVERAFANAEQTTEIDAAAALAQLDAGADAVLVTKPLTVAQIAHVDELGGMLPAGSTALYPPLAKNLVGLVIDPDEDLV